LAPLCKQAKTPPTYNWEVETTPDAYKFVVETLVAVVFARIVPPTTVSVDVTVVEADTNPPYKETVVVAVAPRAVTWARVSALTAAGQFVPFARQAWNPFTNKFVVETTPLAKILVLETFVAVALLNEMFCKDELLVTMSVPAVRPPKLAVVPNRLVLDTTAEANRLVVVTLVPVAIVQVTP
jgi:hypothetical protein